MMKSATDMHKKQTNRIFVEQPYQQSNDYSHTD